MNGPKALFWSAIFWTSKNRIGLAREPRFQRATRTLDLFWRDRGDSVTSPRSDPLLTSAGRSKTTRLSTLVLW
jgi:hypothetical protein